MTRTKTGLGASQREWYKLQAAHPPPAKTTSEPPANGLAPIKPDGFARYSGHERPQRGKQGGTVE